MAIRNVLTIVKLRKGVFVAVFTVVAALLALAFVHALTGDKQRAEDEEPVEKARYEVSRPLASLPDDYTSLPIKAPEKEPEKKPEKDVPPLPVSSQGLDIPPLPPAHTQYATYAPLPESIEKSYQKKTPEETEEDKAIRSALFFTLKKQNQKPSPQKGISETDQEGILIKGEKEMSSLYPEPLIDSSSNQNMQREKRDFLKKKGEDDAVYLPHALQEPLSPYQIMAGTVIPGVMITGINSELPGQIIGQVRENVFDTVTGNHLLIPQGTKLIGRYDSVIATGQERVLIVWNRLIMPDGSSVLLDTMPGTDLGGFSGLKDKVDNHWKKLIAGVLLSSILSVGASVSAGTESFYDEKNGYDITNKFAANVGQSFNQAGQKIVGKMLNIQPTLTIRPGFTFNVMVNKDIVLRPYSG